MLVVLQVIKASINHDLHLFLQIADDVLVRTKDEVWLNMFVADCKSLQEFVNKKAVLLAKELLKLMLEAAFTRNTDICKKFQTMSDTLTKYSINHLFMHKIAFISKLHLYE